MCCSCAHFDVDLIMCSDMCKCMYVTVQSYMQSVQHQLPGASVGLLDQTTTDTATDGATDDSLVFMTPIAEIES